MGHAASTQKASPDTSQRPSQRPSRISSLFAHKPPLPPMPHDEHARELAAINQEIANAWTRQDVSEVQLIIERYNQQWSQYEPASHPRWSHPERDDIICQIMDKNMAETGLE